MKKFYAFKGFFLIILALISTAVYAQVPTITSFSPSSGQVGTTVVITGTNFNTPYVTNTVFFGATKATINSGTSTSLNVTVPAGASYQPVSVINGFTGKTGYSKKPFGVTYMSGSIHFSAPSSKPDNGTTTMAVGDLDNDGKPDVITGEGSGGIIKIYKNNFAGGNLSASSFASVQNVLVSGQYDNLAIQDMNGDGWPEIIATGQYANSLVIIRNNGGNFSNFTTPISVPSPAGFAVGDLDNDGMPDIIVSNNSTGTLTAFRSTTTSGGTPSFEAGLELNNAGAPAGVALGDIDGDGKLDILFSAGASGIGIKQNNSSSGIITIGPTVFFATGSNVSTIQSADLDDDGDLDIIAGNSDNTLVNILSNNNLTGTITSGNFASPINITVSGSPNRIEVADIDGDGKPDILTSPSYPSLNLSVLKNLSATGIINFSSSQYFGPGGYMNGLKIADLDADGQSDIIASVNGLVTFIPNGPVPVATITSFNPTSAVTGATVTITGTNLNVATGVYFGGTPVTSFRVNSSTTISAEVGSGSSGAVSITTGGATASLAGFTLSVPPAITSFTPSSGPVGTLVTITGTDLGNPIAFTIGGTTAIVISNTGTSLVGMVMPGAVTGTVTVTTTGGTASGAGNFTVMPSLPPNTQQGSKIVGTGAVGDAQQGNSVAISADGTTAIVGGYLDNSGQGAVWVYTRSGSLWTQQGIKLVGTGATGAPLLGSSVALSADGNTALVGGAYDNDYVGAVWVFTRSNGVWTQQGNKLVGTGYADQPMQGNSVSLSADGNTAIIGGTNDGSGQGAAWIFQRNGGIWTQQGSKIAGSGAIGSPYFANSVAVSSDGKTLVLGGMYDDSGNGAIWIFIENAGVWSQQGSKLIASGNIGVPHLGSSVAISADGNTVLAGGDSNKSDEGLSWVFIRTGNSWSQQSTLLGLGGPADAKQGSVVSLSADGNTAMVGGYNDSNGLNAAWFFTRTSGVWTQSGDKVNPADYVSGNRWGISGALSSDGNTAFAGNVADDSFTGASWAFTYSPPTITVSGITGTISACLNTASADPNIQQFTVSGVTLTNNITLSAPAGFEISLSQSTGFGPGLSLTQTSGNVANTLVYVRSRASSIAGLISGNVTLTSAGAPTKTVPVTATINGIPTVNTISNATVANNGFLPGFFFTGTNADTFTWVNSNPDIGLPAGPGIGDIGAGVPYTNPGIAPITGTITATPSVSGFAYIANKNDNTVSVINTTAGYAVQTIGVGSQPVDVIVSPDGSRAYVANQADGDISVINTATNTEIKRITISGDIFNLAISADGLILYITQADYFVALDLASENTTYYGAPSLVPSALALSPDGLFAYITYASNSTMIRLDLTQNTYVTTTFPASSAPSAVKLSADGSKAFVALSGTGMISVINTSTMSATAINIGGTPSGLAVHSDGNTLYVSNSSQNVVNIVNTTAGTFTATAVGTMPAGLGLNPDETALYVINSGSNGVSVLNTSTNIVDNSIDVGNSPYAAASFFKGGAGCSGTSTSFTITVLPDPTSITSIVRAGASPSNSAAVAFTVTFADPVGGLTVSNFAASGVAGASVAAISGSGNTYAVTVNTGTGEGTLTLSLVNTTGTRPVTNTLPFSGESYAIDRSVSAPTNLLDTRGNTQVSLNWTASVDADVASYKVFYGTATNPSTLAGTVTAPAVNFTITGLTNGTIYYFAVRAIDALGNESVNSNETSTVPRAPQTITFNPLGNKVFGDSDYSPGATSATSGINPITYSSSNTSVATIIGSSIHIVAPGTTNITASQAQSNEYSAATPVVQPLTIVKANQSITFAALANKTFGNAAFNLTATGGASGNAVTFVSSNTAVATVSGNTVTIVSAGTTNITASQAGTANYNAAVDVVQPLTVGKANQTITFAALAGKTFGDAAFTISATGGGSGNGITFISSNPSVATVSGNTVTILGAGTTNITASQAGNANYNAAADVVQPLTVGKANQTIIFAGIPAKTFGDPSFTLSATGGASGNTVTYVSSNTAVATVSGSTVTITGAGTANITASQAGNANYNAAADVVQTLTVGKANQTITFAAIPAKTFGDPAFTLSATGGASGNTVTFASSNPAVATVSGNTVTILGAGTANITASQAGNANYNAAADVVRALAISQKVLTVTADNKSKVQGQANPALTASYSGFTSGEGIANISTLPAISTAATTGSSQGTYPITVSGGTAANYSFSYVSGSLTVTPSADASLASVSVSAGNLTPAFDPAVFSYTSGVSNTTTSITFSPSANSNGTIKVNGVSLSGNPAAGTVNLAVGANIISLEVTAQDGTVKTYTFTVTRAANTNANLSALTLSSGTLAPAFDANTISYSASMANAVSSVTLTPVRADATSTIKVNGTTVAAGNGLAAALTVGSNTITTVVTAPDGTTTKTYTVVVTRAASADASLSNVTISAGNLSPAFDPAITVYTASVSNTTTSFTINPSAGTGATVKVNGVSQAGNPSAGIVPLTVGSNTITLEITAQDGTVKTYTFTVTRAANASVVNSAPTLDAVSNQVICYTSDAKIISLTGITAGPDAGQATTLSVSSNNNALFAVLDVLQGTGSGTLTYRLNSNVSGTATVTVTVKDNGGTANGGTDTFTRTFTITVNPLPAAAISSSLGLNISKGAETILTATGGTSYSWTTAAGIISGQNTAVLTVKPLVNTTYTVTVSNASGCSSTQSISLTVLEDFKTVEATNIMSPDGDGVNDLFVVKNIELYPNNEVKVFDKAGRLLFNKKGYLNTWDATINGSPLTEGTYYYIVDFGGGKLIKKGYITILRQN